MSTKNTIIFPKIPSDASPEMQKFFTDLMKVVDDINSSINSSLNQIMIPQKKTGGTRDAVPSKPDDPKVGTIYYEDNDGDGHVNCLGVCTAIDNDGNVTWSYVALTEAV